MTDAITQTIQAVILDMDGVLVDSEPLHIKAETKTLAPYGIELSKEEINHYMGMGVKMMLKSLIIKYSLPFAEEALFRIHEKNLSDLFQAELKIMPGTMEMIDHLKNRKIKLALASSSSPGLIDLVLKIIGLKSAFDVVISGEQVVNGKPFPDIFIKTAGLLNIPPDRCVVIEDSKNGVSAAKSAGMLCIGFRSPHSKNQDISQADYIVDDLIQIKDLLSA
jgi:HAD superfamily hydrolase (TIGR01509 family)